MNPSAHSQTEIRYPRFVWAMIASGLVLRLAWLAWFPRVIQNESSDYLRLAENLFRGNYDGILGGPQALFPPLYPLLIAVFTPLLGDAELAARLISVCMGTLMIAVVAKIAGYFGGDKPARIAALLVALHPALIALSTTVLSEVTYFTLILAATHSAMMLTANFTVKRAMGTGAMFGLAYLTRPEALFVAVCAILAVTLTLARRRVQTGFAAGAVTLCTFAVLASPFVVYLSMNSGYLRLEGKTAFITRVNKSMAAGQTYDQAAHSIRPSGPQDWPMTADAFTVPRASLTETVTTILGGIGPQAKKVARAFMRNRIFGYPLLVILAIAGVIRMRPFGGAHLVFGVLAALTIGSMFGVFFLVDRYALPSVPVMLVPASIGITWLSAVAASWVPKLSQRAYAGACLALVILPSIDAVPKQYVMREERKGFVKEVGKFIASQNTRTDTRPRMMGIGSPTAVYAGAALVYLPVASGEETLAYIESENPDYVVLRADEETFRSYLPAWLRDGLPHRCAKLLKEFPVEDSAGSTQVYRWQCPDPANANLSLSNP